MDKNEHGISEGDQVMHLGAWGEVVYIDELGVATVTDQDGGDFLVHVSELEPLI